MRLFADILLQLLFYRYMQLSYFQWHRAVRWVHLPTCCDIHLIEIK